VLSFSLEFSVIHTQHWKQDLHHQLLSFSTPNSCQFEISFSQSSTGLHLNNCRKHLKSLTYKDYKLSFFLDLRLKLDKKGNYPEVRDGSSHLFHDKLRDLIKDNIPVFWQMTSASAFLEKLGK